MAEDRFAGKSQAYIDGFLAMEAELALQEQDRKVRRAPAPTVRADAQPAPTVLTDQLRTGEGSMDFRTDAADQAAPAAQLAGAAASRRKMLVDQGGMRSDAADHRLGLTDQAVRAAHDAATIAKLEASRQAQRADMQRKLDKLGIRMDAAAVVPAASAAKARLQVRSDLGADYRLEPTTRADHAPDRTISASEARRRLHNMGS